MLLFRLNKLRKQTLGDKQDFVPGLLDIITPEQSKASNLCSVDQSNEIYDSFSQSTTVNTQSRKLNLNSNNFEPDVSNLSNICLVMEYFETDLDQIFKYNIEFKESHMLKIAYNSLCALAFIHHANIMHRDVKSANIILNSDCSARICDFGLARTLPFKSIDSGMGTLNVR